MTFHILRQILRPLQGARAQFHKPEHKNVAGQNKMMFFSQRTILHVLFVIDIISLKLGLGC